MERPEKTNPVNDLVNGQLNNFLGELEFAHKIEFIRKANMLFLNLLRMEQEIREKKMEGMSIELQHIRDTINDLLQFEEQISAAAKGSMTQKEILDGIRYAGEYDYKSPDKKI